MDEAFDTLFARAIEVTGGSEASLARRIGCSQHAIWRARRVGRVTAELAAKIDDATAGQVPKSKLRPDLWTPAPEAAE
jgi:DNA-binding transcriptional regulator YdaS (Cro superfamily)